MTTVANLKLIFNYWQCMLIQISAWPTNIVCININVKCKMIMFSYTVFWQVPHPVVSVPNDGFMECNKWMNEWLYLYQWEYILLCTTWILKVKTPYFSRQVTRMSLARQSTLVCVGNFYIWIFHKLNHPSSLTLSTLGAEFNWDSSSKSKVGLILISLL
jgi:hypothetical protein